MTPGPIDGAASPTTLEVVGERLEHLEAAVAQLVGYVAALEQQQAELTAQVAQVVALGAEVRGLIDTYGPMATQLASGGLGGLLGVLRAR